MSLSFWILCILANNIVHGPRSKVSSSSKLLLGFVKRELNYSVTCHDFVLSDNEDEEDDEDDDDDDDEQDEDCEDDEEDEDEGVMEGIEMDNDFNIESIEDSISGFFRDDLGPLAADNDDQSKLLSKSPQMYSRCNTVYRRGLSKVIFWYHRCAMFLPFYM